jgi:serine/threonine protein kinase
MDVQRKVCSRQVIEQFLANELSGGELAALEDHLEGCASCRDVLESMAAEGCWWDEARGYLSGASLNLDEDSGSQTGSKVGGEFHEEASPGLFGLKDYLAPTDDPRMLGRLGGYEVVGIVGCGAMGIVLKAFDGPLNRYVAIKVLGPQLALSVAARQRFIREAKAAAAVVHDNVVAIHSISETNGLPYFVMPYLRGHSLERRLRQIGPFAVEEILRIGMQIARGLAAAHAQGLVHRDIKPANILLDEGVERVTITDFGLARAVDDASLTRTGVIAGTPQYMSPEQAKGEYVDHRSDLFSLGSVLYALATGKAPFRAETTYGVLRRVEENCPRPIREINPGIPDWLTGFIERLQAKEPPERFQSASEVASLLEGFLAHLQQPTTIPAPELPPLPLTIHEGKAIDGDRGSQEGKENRRPGKRCNSGWKNLGLSARSGPAKGMARWLRAPLWLIAFMLLGVLGNFVAVWLSGATEESKASSGAFEDYFVSFMGTPQNSRGFEPIGPDAEQCVKYEPAGLRITLPAGYAGERGAVGLATHLIVHGDFEISTNFEILSELKPMDAGQLGTRLSIMLEFQSADREVARVTRGVHPDGGQRFVAWSSLQDPDTGQGRMMVAPAASKTGRLRLIRTGSTLSYYVADGLKQGFMLLMQHPITRAEVANISLVGLTNGPQSAIDVRFTDLHVRAHALPNLPTGPTPGVRAVRSRSRRLGLDKSGRNP